MYVRYFEHRESTSHTVIYGAHIRWTYTVDTYGGHIRLWPPLRNIYALL